MKISEVKLPLLALRNGFEAKELTGSDFKGTGVGMTNYGVKVGDVIAIQMGNSLTKYKVLAVNEFAKKDDAANMYEVIN